MILSVVETQKQAPQAQFELKVVTEGKRGNKYVSKTSAYHSNPMY